MNSLKIEQFLTDLAVDQNVSPSTQNQALEAVLFLYQRVLQNRLSVGSMREETKKRNAYQW
jgi:hypothetical protein